MVAALVWLAAVGAAIAPWVDGGGEELSAAPLPDVVCDGLRLGVHSSLAFEGDDDRRSAVATAIDAHLHAQIVRDMLFWHQVEARRGERNWSRPDRVVEAVRDAGMEPLLVIAGSPSWASGVSPARSRAVYHVPQRGRALDAWLEHYTGFVAAAVARYRRVVKRWEVWNEPNLGLFWRPRPDPEAYRQVYERLRATILRVDPTAEVAVGGLGSLTLAHPDEFSGRRFLRRLVESRVPMDHVAIHPYATDDHAPDLHVPGESNFDDIGRIHAQLAEHGYSASIWVTEWGWSSATVGRARQAQYVDRSIDMLETRFPYVRVATHFVDHDRPPEYEHGLLDDDLEPKPAAAAFRRRADQASARCHARRGRAPR